MASRCEKTELLETECAHCLGHVSDMAKDLLDFWKGNASVRELDLITRWMPATWDGGICQGCKNSYSRGDSVAKDSNIGWVAKDCCGD